MTTTVDKLGSVPLPVEVLRESDVHPGDQLDICTEDGSIILRKKTQEPPDPLLEILRGLKGLPTIQRSHSKVQDLVL
jgi:bifunctional DNA-binding transcriptional regulator/antitoxin component of YhaV-PrlF toxin-antitoxin module